MPVRPTAKSRALEGSGVPAGEGIEAIEYVPEVRSPAPSRCGSGIMISEPAARFPDAPAAKGLGNTNLRPSVISVESKQKSKPWRLGRTPQGVEDQPPNDFIPPARVRSTLVIVTVWAI